MSERKESQEQQEEGILDLKEAQHMTVEEAKRAESDLQAGISEEDSVLDRYIKRHRAEIASQKFDAEPSQEPVDLTALDTSALDKFIQKQKSELAESGHLSEEKATSLEPESDEATALDEPFLVSLEEAEGEGNHAVDEEETILLADEGEETPIYKNKTVIFTSLAALILGVFGLGYGLNHLNSQKATTKSSATTTTTSSSSRQKAATKEELKAFDDAYRAFYTDETLTKLKNSQFDQLEQLAGLLKKLEGTSSYADAKAKYDKLSKSIKAIQAVNDRFETPALVDGEVVEASLKAGANFDSITTSDKNTGNAGLDSLLQTVIAKGKEQQASAGQESVSPAPEVSTPTPAAPSANTGVAAPAATASSDSSNSMITTGYGIQGYDPAILQRQLSRVPFNDAAIADKSNPAWTFNPGILENIISVSQERGYITGYNFILEPVNIINGNGYYNMYKPDGTYLFSINCKTGYFVGNGPGYADALDY